MKKSTVITSLEKVGIDSMIGARVLSGCGESQGLLKAIHGASGYKAEMSLLRDVDVLRKAPFQWRVRVHYEEEIEECTFT